MRWMLLGLMLVACQRTGGHVTDAQHQQDVATWRKQRLARLTADDGWLTLVGLHWLKDGTWRVGGAAPNDIVLPRGHTPDALGTLTVQGKTVTLAATSPQVQVDGKAAQSAQLKSDAQGGTPTLVQAGSVSFFVIERGDALALRVRDSEAPARRAFTDIPSFPVDAHFRVDATFEAYDPPRQLTVPTVVGTMEKELCPGALVFSLEGQTLRLETVREPGSDALFIVFADGTSGKETYGTGRFLYAQLPENGHAVLDFNKAFNPPCAFSAFATCPLPPSGNRLPVRVEAGEKKYPHPV